MAFNKAKALEAAQKYINQGKLAQAVVEYQHILRYEPNDQVTLMTVGDLLVRMGDPKQALEYFERLAKLFLADGFISKSIAIYKKIAKLVPEDTSPLERLAELYVQQGVMSEARSLYLQLAEVHLKQKRSRQAVDVLRKLLDLEPDNLRVQLHLAELYQAIGEEKEAAQAFLNSAHRLLDRGDFVEAEKMADRALKCDKNNPRALTIKARALGALGKLDAAIPLLEGLPVAERAPDTLHLLVDLYMQSGKSARAVEMARKAFQQSHDQYVVAYGVAMTLLDAGETDPAIDLLGEVREAMMESGDTERLARALTVAAERTPARLAPREWLVDLYRRTSDSFRLPDALDQFGEAAVAAGELEKAKLVFEELLEREPEDENNRRRLNQVRAKLGLAPLEGEAAPAPVEVPAEAPAPFEMELEVAPAPAVVEAPLDEETQHFVTQALTDVDLFSSYGLTQKGIDLLETVLQRAPRHTGALEKLFDLHVGAGNNRRAAELAAQLEQIYREQNDLTNADRFSELRRRFQRAAGLAPEEVAAAAQAVPPAEFVIPVIQAEPVPQVETPAAEVEVQPAEEAVHEVDLSEEWAALALETTEPPAPTVEAAPVEAAPVEPVPVEEQPVEVIELPPIEAEVPPPPVEAAPAPASAAEGVVEYELGVAPAAPPEEVAPPPAPAPAAAPVPAMSTEDLISELAAEVEELELGPALPAATAPPKAPPAPAPAPVAAAAAPVAGGESVEQLREVFEEFRAELGEMGEEAEDPETHYNLGIAYREMGLLEEAIGEFQKVAKSLQGGRQFRYTMQCYTLLGLSFMDKGEPKIAALWYDRALKTPGLDQESVLALRYDLGVAQELAGDRQSALDSFNQVYAMNIDYRDVAERIASLQKRS